MVRSLYLAVTLGVTVSTGYAGEPSAAAPDVVVSLPHRDPNGAQVVASRVLEAWQKRIENSTKDGGTPDAAALASGLARDKEVLIKAHEEYLRAALAKAQLVIRKRHVIVRGARSYERMGDESRVYLDENAWDIATDDPAKWRLVDYGWDGEHHGGDKRQFAQVGRIEPVYDYAVRFYLPLRKNFSLLKRHARWDVVSWATYTLREAYIDSIVGQERRTIESLIAAPGK
jgi:hypothetical protein